MQVANVVVQANRQALWGDGNNKPFAPFELASESHNGDPSAVVNRGPARLGDGGEQRRVREQEGGADIIPTKQHNGAGRAPVR